MLGCWTVKQKKGLNHNEIISGPKEFPKHKYKTKRKKQQQIIQKKKSQKEILDKEIIKKKKEEKKQGQL